MTSIVTQGTPYEAFRVGNEHSGHNADATTGQRYFIAIVGAWYVHDMLPSSVFKRVFEILKDKLLNRFKIKDIESYRLRLA